MSSSGPVRPSTYFAVTFLLASLALGACTYAPEWGDPAVPGEPVEFAGYAPEPRALVTVEVLTGDDEWEAVARTFAGNVASVRAGAFYPDLPALYPWRTHARFFEDDFQDLVLRVAGRRWRKPDHVLTVRARIDGATALHLHYDGLACADRAYRETGLGSEITECLSPVDQGGAVELFRAGE